MDEKENILRVLLNSVKTILSTKLTGLKDFHVDHDTKHFNIKIEITER